ncbi:HD domain-containing protein [Chitinophaga nivalis]|uniref:HD domain-containing protein n=1 Tax=Chitinophaga nivalis TaxID=2991709 RepID=A0ABT3IWV0_9BACT|nr:HD domain-containing protein [Chitinophaga nivalis]MCW3461874.1 HD domain-containing protein [Chitinophaga nivalis]MCW3488435.1 HD domain-containing protein [Chitinophaga nivalis]
MTERKRKIVNDPVYGFITIDHPLIFNLISHPYYQRLRRIHQMALAHLVYPGAMHTRFHHSMGAYHLMCMALQELKSKGADITPEEEVAAKMAILLHDIGHGPYSHALENGIIEGVSHEAISQWLMEELNRQLDNSLLLTLDIFNGRYHKKFLHQLVSSQLDVDRMDYLNRDSFYTGVAEGTIGYDRIIKMLTVHNGELMVEEKGIYSIEKFIIARRLMYWQVYLHKTVLSAENMLVKVLTRAKALAQSGQKLFCSPALEYFLYNTVTQNNFEREPDCLRLFCLLDDYDIMGAIKVWTEHPDKVLSLLCKWLINRNLFKVVLSHEPFDGSAEKLLTQQVAQKWGIKDADMGYFVFSGAATLRAYNVNDEKINILFKDGTVKDISSIDNALISHTLAIPVKKFYICHPKI